MKLIFLMVLFPCLIGAQYYETTNDSSDEYQTVSESLGIIVKSWYATDVGLRKISEKFVHALLPYVFTLTTTSELSPNCSKDMVNFVRGIAETKLWAYQMVDAYGIIPVGIMRGTVSTLGDYNSCLNVTAHNLFVGKYCSVDLEIPLPEQRHFHTWRQDLNKVFDLTHNDTVISEFLSWGERLYMLHPRIAICLPSTCTTEDAQHLAKQAIQLAGLQFNTNVKNCETRQDVVEMTFLDLLSMLLLFTVILVVTVSTSVDFYQRVTSDISHREDEELSWLLYFSLFINTGRLVKKDNNPDSIRVFYGIRAITMIWLIFTHVTVIDRVQAFGGLRRYFELSSSFLGQLSPSGLMGVETFFFMSATLLSYHVIKTAEQKTSATFLFVKRYFRTTIPQVLMIAVTLLLPFVSSGPLYREIIGREAQNCKERGWMNLLQINNFIPFSQICMGNTWYLAVDTQLFLIGILVIVPLRKNPRAAILCLVGLLFFGVIGVLISHLLYNLPPTMLTIDAQMEYIDDLFQKSYFLPHFHLPTYCIGLLSGYFLALRKYVRVSMKVNLGLWTAALSSMFLIVFGPYVWNRGTEFPGILPSVLFGCTHRVLWSVSLAWITIACHSNHGGIIGKFLGSERFLFINRLTFMAYLTNFTIKYLYVGTTSNIIVYNLAVIMNMFMSIVVATFLASFALTLLFEAPFMNLEKALIVKLKERKIGKGK